MYLHVCTLVVVGVAQQIKLEMWANAQRDGRPAEHRWRPLFNAAKFGWRPLLECGAVTLPRRETRWNLLGVPQTRQRISAVSRPTFTILWGYVLWRTYRCLTSSFPIVDMCLSCEHIARQSCAMVPRWRLFGDFLGPVFPANSAQHVSDLHSKFTLGPHHVTKYGRHPFYSRWD